jgi:uncharacterized protein YndB with AHSA1/START domain
MTLELTMIPNVRAGLLIRRPPEQVFQAFVDPTITTRFWFTKSTGKLTPGADVRWEWEMYGVSANVHVEEIQENRLLRFVWGDDNSGTTVEFRFTPWENDGTYVEVTESGLSGDGDQLAAHLADSTGGFTFALCAAKALLEHDIALTVVRDAHPSAWTTAN